MNSLTKRKYATGFLLASAYGEAVWPTVLLDPGYQLMAYNRSREAAEAMVRYGRNDR